MAGGFRLNRSVRVRGGVFTFTFLLEADRYTRVSKELALHHSSVWQVVLQCNALSCQPCMARGRLLLKGLAHIPEFRDNSQLLPR